MEVAKITPDELMCGNLVTGVYDDGEAEQRILCTVTGYDPYEFGIYVESDNEDIERYDSFESIPITEDWLIKLGFDYYPENQSYQLDTNLGFNLWGRDGIINIYSEYSDQIGEDMLFIHQIQNCVFALTQQPLTIKK